MGLDDLSNDIKAALYSRLSSPAAGAFLISWCLWNIDAVLIIAFGDGTMQERIKEVTGTIINDKMDLLWHPLWISVMWLALYPIFSWIVFWYWEVIKLLKEKKRIALTVRKPISATEHKRLLQEIADQKDQYSELLHERDALNTQINALTEQAQKVTPLEEEVGQFKAKIEDMGSKYQKTIKELQKARDDLTAIQKENDEILSENHDNRQRISELKQQLERMKENQNRSDEEKYFHKYTGALRDANFGLGEALKSSSAIGDMFKTHSVLMDRVGGTKLGDALKLNSVGGLAAARQSLNPTYYPKLSMEAGEISNQLRNDVSAEVLEDRQPTMKEAIQKDLKGLKKIISPDS